MEDEDPEKLNERELMDYFGYKGRIGNIRLKLRFLRSWILQSLASISPHPRLAVIFQRARGVKIGQHVYIGPNVYIDLLYPELVTIEDYVSIGWSMIFAHSNPSYSLYLKKKHYPRQVASVVIKRGAWIPPGSIILHGVTIGENSVVAAGSLVRENVEPFSLVAGRPAKLIRKLTKEE